MKIGMIGLGRMGANMERRLMRHDRECVVFDRAPAAIAQLVNEGAQGAASLATLVASLPTPCVLWLMVPAGVVDATIADIVPLLQPGDVIIDSGNSYYVHDIRRSKELAARGLHYVDVGTSGGVFGLELCYCQMIGGEAEIVAHREPIFAALAPLAGSVTPTEGRTQSADRTADRRYRHCGPAGAGHFVKMVHNGIEYGLMAAYADGLNILQHANIGKASQEHDAETTPLRDPEHYQYNLNVGEITELWRRGSVVSSWLLDLAAQSLVADPTLSVFAGRVSNRPRGMRRQAEPVALEALAQSCASSDQSRSSPDFRFPARQPLCRDLISIADFGLSSVTQTSSYPSVRTRTPPVRLGGL